VDINVNVAVVPLEAFVGLDVVVAFAVDVAFTVDVSSIVDVPFVAVSLAVHVLLAGVAGRLGPWCAVLVRA
jgi:hypothetical protein